MLSANKMQLCIANLRYLSLTKIANRTNNPSEKDGYTKTLSVSLYFCQISLLLMD